jgi:ubiquinone/menaquinone biosynthesis C-methylase UbiE
VSQSPEEQKAQSREFWDRMALQWERRRQLNARSTSHIDEWLVDAIGLEGGETVLDLAAGTGETGFEAARRVGHDGRLISSDFSPEMVRAAERAGTELGITNAEFRVLDAEDLDLDGDSVDGVVCRFGLMLFPNASRALGEIRRVLRDGGRFACSTWGPPDKNPWMTTSAGIVIERGLMDPPGGGDGGPGMFAMADAQTIAPLFEAAGFESVRTETMDVAWRFGSADELWAFASELQGPVAVAISELGPEERADVRRELEERARPFADGRGYALPGLALNTVAS